MSITQLVAVLRAHRWLALLLFLLTIAGTMAATFMMPKKYTATASLVIDQTRPDPISGILYQHYLWGPIVATQVDVIKSDTVARRVVQRLNLAHSPNVRQQWFDDTQGRGNMESWLTEQLQRSIDVKPARESNVINVSVTALDPLQAASLTNALIDAYQEVSVELRTDQARRSSSFFDTRAKELAANLERAQARLSSYQREKGIIATDEKVDIETMRLNELSSQLTALQAVSSESNSRQAQALGGGADRLQEVVTNPLIVELRAELSRAEARLQELNSRLGDNHPAVQEAKANIRSLRARIDGETNRVVGSVRVGGNINRQREAEIRSLLEAQRAKVLRMKAVRDESAVMQRDIENAQRAYDTVLARLNQTSLESQATNASFLVLTQATPPSSPSSPKIFLNVAISVIVGLILAAGAVTLRELGDRRVRTGEQVPALLGVPMLGVLPKPGAKALFADRRVPLVVPRPLHRLQAPRREA